MEKNFWNHLGLLLQAVIGVGFLLTCIGIMIFFFNYTDPLVCLFGTLGYVIILADNALDVFIYVNNYFEYRNRKRV